jgi:DnaJ-class molecular chaperone
LKKNLIEKCPRCKGKGTIEYQPTSVPRREKILCPECHGKGKLRRRKEEKNASF